MKKIEESAEDMSVPEELAPERIRERLKQEKKKKRIAIRKKTEIAAAIVLIVSLGGFGAYQFSRKASSSEAETQAAIAVEPEIHVKKEQVGSYRLAKSYEDVENAIAYETESGRTQGSYESEYKLEAADIAEESIADSASIKDLSTSNGDFSTTNTQVEGVDESDFVKNDGNYLYVQTDDCVSVIDIRDDQMKVVSKIEPQLGTADLISDMYVDGDRLFLVVEKRDSEIVETTQNGDFGIDDFYNAVVYTDTTDSTQLLTYDISGSKEGKLLGSVTVDGSCETSRKVGDMIYLFTSRYVAGQTDGDDGVIPQVNGGKISADCIFIQENAKKEFIMVSVDTNKPNETVDQLVLLDAGVEVYMGTDAIYLYQSDYQEDASYTDITKFSYKDGYMDAVAAASVVGTIQDTFAISERDGILRVLTTDWTKEESENRLYLLDENLKRKGLLNDLAAGEEIYAARYIGDIAYFITYHNTDPLFAVDISDPADPNLLGQVEMTGFSDYLHPFGENLLLGIGYETDPETSEQQGVKLTMFDISDPLNLKIVDSVIMEGDYCAAASNYKCALVDVKKNLIGFEVVDYGESIKQNYVVYSWNNNHFSRKMQKDLEEKYSEDEIRGLYAGSRFYLIYGKEIHSFDMERKWKKIEVLQL